MPLLSKTFTTLLAFTALVLSLRWIPGVQWFRPPDLETVAGIDLDPVEHAQRP